MNRRAFLRRMAAGALAGMLGLELTSRSQIDTWYVKNRDHIQRSWLVDDRISTIWCDEGRFFYTYMRRADGRWDASVKDRDTGETARIGVVYAPTSPHPRWPTDA